MTVCILDISNIHTAKTQNDDILPLFGVIISQEDLLLNCISRID
jgi:hypothetical protein